MWRQVCGLFWMVWVASACGSTPAALGPSSPDDSLPDNFVRVLTPCTIGGIQGPVECGTFTVWEDREASSGRTVDLRFVIARATGQTTQPDPIIFFQGGPGAGSAGPSFMGGFTGPWAHLRTERDFIFVDQRGTGGSNLMTCPGPFPSGEESLFGALFPPDHIAQCATTLSAGADLRHYSTTVAVDDIAEVFEWLGVDQVNLAGFSYGTRMALAFLQRHPQRVRTIHINGVAPNGVNIHLNDAPHLDAALDRFVESCGSCPPDLTSDIHALAASLDAGPVATLVQRSDGSTAEVAFNRGDFGYAVRGMLYGNLAGNFPAWTAEAMAGDWSSYANYYRRRAQWTGSSTFATGMHLSVFCSEDIPFTTDLEISEITDGTLLGASLYRRYEEACDGWAAGVVPQSFHDPVRSTKPGLIVSGERDPVTPPLWGERVAETLTGSVHLVIPAAGHVPFTACVITAVTALVRDGNTLGIPASCPAG